MRRIENKQDDAAMKLLSEGAEAAAGKAHLDKKIAQLSDQVRMLQYSLSKVLQTLGSFPAIKSQIDQLDYRTLGIARAIADMQLTTPAGPTEKFTTFNDLVETHARQAKIDAFDELSNSDDEKRGLAQADSDEINDQHWVILTSECKSDADQGIFRSKIEVSSEEFSDLKASFLGKKVGDTIDVKLQGHDHIFTILGLRKKPDATPEK